MQDLNEKLSTFQGDPNSFINMNFKHIPSVGDPWIMFYQNKKEKRLMNSSTANGNPRKEYIPFEYGHQNYTDPVTKNKKKSNFKKIHVSFTCFDKITKTLVVALIDKEVKIYRVKENGSRISLEHRFSFYVKNIVTYMEITRFIVNDYLILIVGTNCGKVEIYYIDEKPAIEEAIHKNIIDNKKKNEKASKDDKLRDSAILHKVFDMDKENELIISKLQYAKGVGLIVCALNHEETKAAGWLKCFDPVDFEQIWNYQDLIRDDKPDKNRINITCMDHSEANGLIALGGTEGNIIIVDSAALKVINNTNTYSSEILEIYFYDEQHQLISIGKNGAILIWDTHKMEVLQSFKDDSGI